MLRPIQRLYEPKTQGIRSTPIYTQDTASSEEQPEDSEKRYYVYVYFDSFTHEPFYVGKGSRNRYRHHIADVKVGRISTPKHNKIEKILSSGGFPRIVIAYRGLTESEAFCKERSIIAHYGRRFDGDGPLLNMSEGGEGNSGNRHCRDTSVYTLYHVSGVVVKMTKLEFREKVCNGNHQTTASFFNGTNKVCNYYAFERSHLIGIVDPNKYYDFFDHVKNMGYCFTENNREPRLTAKNFRILIHEKQKMAVGISLYKNADCSRFISEDEISFTNIETRETVSMTVTDFKKFVNSDNVPLLMAGTISHIKRWIVGSCVPESIDFKYNRKRIHCIRNKHTGVVLHGTIDELKEVVTKGIFEVLRGNKSVQGWSKTENGA